MTRSAATQLHTEDRISRPPALRDQDADPWIISDTHFGHKKMTLLCNRPPDHSERIEHHWRSLVHEDDLILHLGDLTWYRDACPEDLPGHKYLILGNHDRDTWSWYTRYGFTPLHRHGFAQHHPEHGPLTFSHEPVPTGVPFRINIHGHIHNNPHWIATGRIEDRINACVEMTDYAPIKLSQLLLNHEGGIT